MRISDWSSDVCSSDRPRGLAPQGRAGPQADGGLQPRASPQRRLRVRLHAARVALDPLREVGPPRVLRRRDVPADGDGQRRLLPEADELPDEPPGVQEPAALLPRAPARSEEHTSELQSLMRISYAVFCLNKKNIV